MVKKINKSEQEWKAELSPETYKITRLAGTERAFTSKYNNFKEDGIFKCVCCNTDLFDSKTKYDSGSGWPSFYDAVAAGNITLREDNHLFMTRTEILCSRCDAHLGHVFEDGPQPTGMRYCVNSASLKFSPEKEK